jgi:hypothetical protein
VALKLLERRHSQRWGPGRADVLAVPDEFPPETPAPAAQKPQTLSDQYVYLSEEWQLPIRKLFTAAAFGRTPRSSSKVPICWRVFATPIPWIRGGNCRASL